MTQPALFDDDAPDAALEPAKPARAGITKRTAPPLREPFAEPQGLRGFAPFEREAVARGLLEVVAEYESGGTCPADELFRYVRGSLYVLTPDEVVAVANRLANLLRANDERTASG